MQEQELMEVPIQLGFDLMADDRMSDLTKLSMTVPVPYKTYAFETTARNWYRNKEGEWSSKDN